MLTVAFVLASAILLRRVRANNRPRRRLFVEGSASDQFGRWFDVRRAKVKDRKHAGAVATQLPEVIEAIARSLRAGASLRGALFEGSTAATGRLGDDLRLVGADVSAGVALPDALDGWARRYRSPLETTGSDRRRRAPRRVTNVGRKTERRVPAGNRETSLGKSMGTGRPDPLVAMTATVLAIAAELGGAQAKTLDGLVVTLRDRRTMAGEVRAASAQARLSAWVMVSLPIGFALVQALTNRASAHFLFATPAGGLCLLIGLTLDGVGALWMHRMVRPP